MSIQEFATTRGIEYLFHFTRVDNLPSILAHGLLPLDHLDARRLPSLRNDTSRADRTAGLCLSIAFPNYKMFYPLRKENPEVQWVVLAIRPSVLWEGDCAFCMQNAAKGEVAATPLYLRKGLTPFQAMFEDFPGVPRSTLNLAAHVPTHPQAEVLVFNPIPRENIAAIIFNNLALKKQYAAMNLPVEVLCEPRFFSARHDFDKWKANG